LSRELEDNLKEVVSTVTDVHPDRTSKSGTSYCAFEIEAFSGEWFFLWDGSFKDDVETFPQIYKGEKVQVLYKDKEDEPGEHFFNAEIIVPEKPEKCRKLLDLKTRREKE